VKSSPPPPFLLGSAVLFWGWQTGLLPFAVVLAPLLEGARLSPWRWDVARRDVNRVADLCVVLLGGMALYLFATASGGRTSSGPRAVTLLFQWVPLALAPLMVCQLYSTVGRLELSALFWTLRKRAAPPGVSLPAPVDLRYPYLVACVLAASAASTRGPEFYLGVCVLAAWALWTRRSPRVPLVAWALLVIAAAGAGYAGQVGLRALQHAIEQAILEHLFGLRDDMDPFRSSTAIGSLGRLKLSDRIVLRVTPHDSVRIPLLLREASYNVYHGGSWYAVNSDFTTVPPESDGQTWKLVPGAPGGRKVTVAAYLKSGAGILALPLGAFEIGHLAVVGLGVNRLGAVKVQEGLGLVTYTALTSGRAGLDAPPEAGDLRLPAREARILPPIVDGLGLASIPSARAVAVVRAYFARDFRYSTWGGQRRPAADALEEFLVRERAGHCEYFATATALLLRTAGIPARYAVGYSVQEWSRLEGAYVARARHAHSWVLAWIDDRWVDVDTTPPVWADEERPAAAWEWLGDLWSWTVFQFSRWRWSEGGGGPVKYLAWLLAPLVLVLMWRIYARTHVGRRAIGARAAGARAHGGQDSEFYLIERRLAEAGLGRRPSEPAAVWARRLQRADGLEEIVALHDRYRFDPGGIAQGQRQALREKATAWLSAHARGSDARRRG
jgi:hypothetical protein